LMSTQKEGVYYHKITTGDEVGNVILSQGRALSKRLLRRIYKIGTKEFEDICNKLNAVIIADVNVG
jgi:hypothetical protein